MTVQALRSLRPSVRLRKTLLALTFFSTTILTVPLDAQTASNSVASTHAPADRLTLPIQENARVALPGTLHPLANKVNDRGAVGDGMKLDRIQVVLKRSDQQESALKRLIGEMHTPGTPSYHKWLTPEAFGKQFGPSDADVAKLESWLGSHGFSITKLNPGRQTIEIAGTAGQFRDTFHAQIHSYQTGGETHFANASAPEIPAALAPVFGGFASLNNFHLKSHAHVLGTAQFTPATHESKPDWTYGSGSSFSLLVTPADFAVQYNLNPLYSAGTNGNGQSIAIVNEANINIAQVNNYRALFGLPVNPPQVVIDGSDPGIDGNNSPYGRNGASLEAYLDVEVAGAVAPNAQINLVIADSTAIQDGLEMAAERAVYSNISPVLSLSFGQCEATLQASNAFWSNLWEQAAAQGITVLVSTGDSGSAACDDDNSQEYAVSGQAVNGIASTPYNVAVGGTDFYYSGGSADFATYWKNLASPTTSAPSESLIKTIPEQPFNSSQFGLDIYPQSNGSGTTIFAAGGGASTLGLAGASGYGPYPKPSWQTGTGVPADGVRDIPDVSLFGSLSTDGSYTPLCASDGDCQGGSKVQVTGVGGTSASAPEFAGMMALVNQKYGRQGQADYVLYPLARQFPASFNDVQNGTNTVPCNLETVFDSNNNNAAITPNDCQSASPAYTVTDNEFGTSLEGEIGFSANTAAYTAGVGYDLASGLGSVNANNLVTNWGSVRTGVSTTTLNASSTTFAHGTAVTISGTVSGASPTGSVALITTSSDANKQGETVFPLTSGGYTGSVNTLPGGTYDISGFYSGDGSNGASSSTPLQVTVTPEASTTALTIYTTALANPAGRLASGGTVSYGAVTALSAKETGSTSGTSSKPTGSVAFLDGATALNTAVVNVEGDAEFTQAFAVGAHSVSANYSGDGSYNKSGTTVPTTFMVVANTPNIFVTYPNADSNGDAVSGQTTYVAVQVENSSSYPNSQALPPAGTVSVLGAPAGVVTTATLVPSVDPFGSAAFPYGNVPEGTAYFAFPASYVGTPNLTFTYAPAATEVNYKTASYSQQFNFLGSAGSVATTLTASATTSTTSPVKAVLVTATVAAASGSAAPTGAVVLYASEQIVDVAYLPTGTGSSATVTFGLSSSGLPPGTNQITAQYFPNTNTYIGSATTFTVANPTNDFALVPVTTIVSVPGTGVSAGLQTDVINLNSYSGFAGAVSLTCTASVGVTCSLSSTSVSLASAGTGSTTLSVNTSGVTAAGTYSVVVTGTDSTGHLIHTIGLQVVTPLILASTTPGFSLTANPTAVSISAPGGSGTSAITATPVNGFTGTVALTCAVAGPAGATDIPTCAAASESITGTTAATATLTFSTLATTTAGSYAVTVTGTSGGVTATTTVTVTVVGVVVTPGTFAVANSAAITVASQGGSGSSTISVVPNATNPFTGSVALTCAITASPTGASEIPTCSLSPASVTLAGATLTSTLTISTTAQTGKLDQPLKGFFTAGGGMALAALLFCGVPIGQRGRRRLQAVRTLRILFAALFFAMVAGAGIGCGSGSSNGGGTAPPSGGTTTGAYTVTVSGTPSAGTAQTVSVSLTVN